MKVAVMGTGHVGLITAATLAKIGHDVAGIDDDESKVARLQAGQAPFYEPDLPELLAETIPTGRLRFSSDPAEGIPGADVAFICVGTPARPDGDTNLLAVEQATATAGRLATGPMVVVHKSTVPVQTAQRVAEVLARTSTHPLTVVSNPEFLREGRAVRDSLHPDRILVGSDDAHGHEVMRRLYEPLLMEGVAYHETDLATAELSKHACNAFLALKISYANALARVCELAGADVVAVAGIMGTDPRIGRDFLDAGLGYGGYCLPKDVAAFRAQAARLGYEFGLLDEVVRSNELAIASAFDKVRDAVWNLEGKRIALLGLAFKPGTDDIRESPALKLAQLLIDAGASVAGHDPAAGEAAAAAVPGLEVKTGPYEAAQGAGCAVVCTAWPEYADLDLARLREAMAAPVIVDGRNALDPDAAAAAGFTYFPTGRPPVKP